MKTESYKKWSNLNFITSKTLNKSIGIEYFKWIVKNTFFKFFNQKIKLKNKKTELSEIRKEMTIAEISHLIGFIFVSVIALYKSISHNYLFGLTIMMVNILMNLYPVLLQQENKRRIDKLIKGQSVAEGSTNVSY
ncbi:glycosyl-4,4'-diaponeurosporenoate acyltransferase CrtO family protein [Sinomicrobium sp. M5D2P9]